MSYSNGQGGYVSANSRHFSSSLAAQHETNVYNHNMQLQQTACRPVSYSQPIATSYSSTGNYNTFQPERAPPVGYTTMTHRMPEPGDALKQRFSVKNK